MTIHNPLADNSPDHEGQNLALRARSGDRQALEDLVQRASSVDLQHRRSHAAPSAGCRGRVTQEDPHQSTHPALVV